MHYFFPAGFAAGLPPAAAGPEEPPVPGGCDKIRFQEGVGAYTHRIHCQNVFN